VPKTRSLKFNRQNMLFNGPLAVSAVPKCCRFFSFILAMYVPLTCR